MDEPFGDLERLGLVHDLAQHGELVSAEARQGVDGPKGGAQALGHTLEELVSALVAEAVVDELEAVEVEEHERHAVVVTPGPAQCEFEAVHEQHPVGQPRELVVHRGVGQTLAHLATFGHVFDLADQIHRPSGVVAHAAVLTVTHTTSPSARW